MKNTALALTIICFLTAGQTYAACKSDACRQAVAWKDGYTAIVLDDDITSADYLAVLSAIQTNNGVVAIEAERVLLGWVPVAATGKVRATRGVRAVLRETAAAQPEALVRNPHALDALSFFNRVVSGEYEDAIEAGLAFNGSSLTGCVVARPRATSVSVAPDQSTSSDTDVWRPLSAGRMRPTTNARPDPRPASEWGYRTPYQNPDMRGRISVQVFRLDSDGTSDSNLYTWTSADLATSRDQVYGAFNFWVSQATARGITVSFRINIVDTFSRYTRQYVPTKTKYEPITRSSVDDYLWVNDALKLRGYGASPVTPTNVYNKNEEFNRANKTDVYGTTYDRSFTVYIVYNPTGAPEVFANNRRAYAMEDGPFVMVMWNSAGWSPQNLGKVITHETGHIFWACDEYYDADSNSGCFSCGPCFTNVGPRNWENHPEITNANCDKVDADESKNSCDVTPVACIMRSVGYAALCPHTPGQVGW